jgi:hypothetical protein
MKTTIKSRWIVGAAVILALVLFAGALAVSLGRAQSPDPPRTVLSPEGLEAVSDFIPVQGRLTDSAGIPLNGTYTLTFRLYDAAVGGTVLCEDSRSPVLNGGLFSSYMRADECPIDGRQLYLSVEVGDDGEMTPRQFIDNVPYAWSLRPGAKVEADEAGPILSLHNLGSGPALAAQGRITSSEPTYLWISGNGVRPYRQADSTIIDMNNHGGADIRRGATSGSKNVMLPITIPGTLYGQDVRVTGLDLYWVGATQFDVIQAVLLRRQTGVCSDPECYAVILHDSTDYGCDVTVEPNGCTLHFDLTANTVLSADSGVLYITIELGFSGEASVIDFGGARLTLEYDD